MTFFLLLLLLLLVVDAAIVLRGHHDARGVRPPASHLEDVRFHPPGSLL